MRRGSPPPSWRFSGGASSRPTARPAASALEQASWPEVWLAMKKAVRAYARNPSEANALEVERVVLALRHRRDGRCLPSVGAGAQAHRGFAPGSTLLAP